MSQLPQQQGPPCPAAMLEQQHHRQYTPMRQQEIIHKPQSKAEEKARVKLTQKSAFTKLPPKRTKPQPTPTLTEADQKAILFNNLASWLANRQQQLATSMRHILLEHIVSKQDQCCNCRQISTLTEVQVHKVSLKFCSPCYQTLIQGSFCDFCHKVSRNPSQDYEKEWLQCARQSCRKWNHVECEIRAYTDSTAAKYKDSDMKDVAMTIASTGKQEKQYWCVRCRNNKHIKAQRKKLMKQQRSA